MISVQLEQDSEPCARAQRKDGNENVEELREDVLSGHLFPLCPLQEIQHKPTGGLLPAPSTLPPTEPASGPCVSCSLPSRSILPAYSLTRLPAFPSPPPLRDPLCWWSEDPDQS